MALVSVPAIGSASNKPVKLSVRLSGQRNADENANVSVGIRQLYNQREFCDVTLVCAEQEFRAHKCVLAAKSEVFRALLKDTDEVRFQEVSNPEAVKWMLDFFYEIGYGSLMGTETGTTSYMPASQAINVDVLRLAQKYSIPELRARAALFMTRDLTTHNAVDRLATCDEFGLTELREKILEQLTANKKALAEVTSSPAINSYPALMREMLALIASAGCVEEQKTASKPVAKKARKA